MDIIVMKVPQELRFAEIEGYKGCLTAARRKIVERKKSEGDKINSLLSQLLVLSEISRRTGLPTRKISFRLGTNGKPYLRDGELWFSLSHTRGAVAAAFCSDNEIGVDIELRSRKINPDMYRRVLSAEELSKTRSDADFIRFWVQKEAFLKRLGLGITRELRGIAVPKLPDTAVYNFGEYVIGASGKGALSAEISEITTEELLGRFTKLL